VNGLFALLAAVAVGALLGWGLSRALHPVMSSEVFDRTNYRGHHLPTAMGIVLPLVLALAVAPESFRWSPIGALGVPTLLAVLGFSFLGLLDDLAGVGQSGGFRGHVDALLRGRLTTGMVKLVGGPFVAIVVVGALADRGTVQVLRDAATIALAANAANLFDRAPGRVAKVGLISFAAVAVGAWGRLGYLAAPGVAMGALAGLLPGDLREEHMLGDAGSNAAGAVVGLTLVVVVSGWLSWLVLLGLLALNLASEVVSFSRVIDGTPPLRWLDRLGSPHRRP
jgi:UDP-N-acetylmuramyl pentapeptide phosphotransferase/UDP-N-acetylglucosamine-1-phosphate transferase